MFRFFFKFFPLHLEGIWIFNFRKNCYQSIGIIFHISKCFYFCQQIFSLHWGAIKLFYFLDMLASLETTQLSQCTVSSQYMWRLSTDWKWRKGQNSGNRFCNFCQNLPKKNSPLSGRSFSRPTSTSGSGDLTRLFIMWRNLEFLQITKRDYFWISPHIIHSKVYHSIVYHSIHT